LNSIFYEMIFMRKSFHIFRNVGNESIGENELNDIQNAYSEFTPLNPEIKTAIRIVPEKKDGYLQNIGYLGEQLDLYLVSRNIGTLWFGIGKTKEEPFEDMFKSKRKNVEEIWEGEQIPGVTDIVFNCRSKTALSRNCEKR